MNNQIQKKNKRRQKRAYRVRKKVRGTASIPRLSVSKSLKHIQVQLIDDENGRTLAGTATFAKPFANTECNRISKQSARKLGEYIGKAAQEQNITSVVFDRGPYKYHGIVAELADFAREAGLKF